ncbi:hypothetical protein ACEWY4_024845 [Coilia grayii]|uniref:Uncharacterized protein n=1 Tax=Coilia grayii TaxID=363190 RepID=A0ABD1IYY7_9TELE
MFVFEVSTSSYCTSMAGDDRSISGSSDTSDTSQSDSSIGSRLAIWTDPCSSSTGPTEGPSQSGTKSATLLVDEKLPITLAGGPRLSVSVATSTKPSRSRRLQEIGRQSSSDSGIATGSHSSYSGSFSSYTSSLDVTGGGSSGAGAGEDFGSVLSLLPAPLTLASAAGTTGASGAPPERTLCTCPPCPGHEYQVPSSALRYLYDTPRSLLLPQPGSTSGGADEGAEGGICSAEHQACTFKDSEAAQATPGDPGRLSRGNSSEGAPPGDEVVEVCNICTPRAIYTTCSICGGLKGAPVPAPGVPLVPGQRTNEPSVTTDQEANQQTALEITTPHPGQEKQLLTAPASSNGNSQKHGYLNYLSDLLEHYDVAASSGARASSQKGYEPMASALGAVLKPPTCSRGGKQKPQSQNWKNTVIYENCYQCRRGESGCMAIGVNRIERGRDALLAGRRNCNGGTACKKVATPESCEEERSQDPECHAKEVPPDLAIPPRMGAQSAEVSDGSVDVDRDKKKQRCKADPAYEVMESRTTERSSEAEEKSKYELMGSYGQQRIPHIDLEGGVFVFPSDVPVACERPKGDGVTYVNIPVSPTSKKQLNYMELELQETSSASVRGRGSTKYAQIDITATETAHKVGTQHALGREEGLLKLEQKRRGGLPQ